MRMIARNVHYQENLSLDELHGKQNVKKEITQVQEMFV